MLSAPRSSPPPRCCWSIFCSASGWSAPKPCMPRYRTPTKPCVSTKASNSGKAAPSQELRSRCARKPPPACLLRDEPAISACATDTIRTARPSTTSSRSEEHTSELQSHSDLVCRLLLEKKKKKDDNLVTDYQN